MTKADGRGVPVTTRTDAELASIDSFTARLLRLDRGAEAILEDARSFPDSPMVQLSAAAFCLLGQTHASDAAAHDFLDATAPLLASATERERRLHRLMTMWRGQDHLGALAEAEAITADWPRDLFTAKLAEFFYYVLGQQHEGPRFLAHMQRLAPANPGDPDLLGMLAFAQELCGNVTEAAASADKAIALEPRNPWAHHCIAHLHLRCGDTAEAVHALESFLPSWITSGRFAHCHNAWHLALAHLETLNTGRALEVFERHVWGFAPDLVFEQVDAIALLWRLELAGIDVGTRWQGLADKAAAHLNERYMPFLDAHFVYALTRAGRSEMVGEWLARIAARSAAQDREARRSWAPVGQPLVQAVAAFAQGDEGGAAELLDPIMGEITLVGGSDAQVQLFRQTYYHGLARCGRKADARAYWQQLVGSRPPSELDRYVQGLAS